MGFSVRKRCRSKRLSRYTTIWKVTLSEKYYGEWDGAGVAQELADEMTSRGLIATYNHPGLVQSARGRIHSYERNLGVGNL